MENQHLQPGLLSRWKRLAIISFFGGIGFALTAGMILWGVVWHASRPTPPKPWDTTVIVAKESPGFGASNDGKELELNYTLENAGSNDYRISSVSGIEILARGQSGTLSQPLPDAEKLLRLPIFIPARQKARILLSLDLNELPIRDTGESDAAFHERLRNHLEQAYSTLGGFAIFDRTNRYQIDLPKWLAKEPKQPKTPGAQR